MQVVCLHRRVRGSVPGSATARRQKRLGKLVRPAALYAGPDARTPDTVEGWKDVNATSIRWP